MMQRMPAPKRCYPFHLFLCLAGYLHGTCCLRASATTVRVRSLDSHGHILRPKIPFDLDATLMGSRGAMTITWESHQEDCCSQSLHTAFHEHVPNWGPGIHSSLGAHAT